MPHAPQLSVVIPVYNEESTLRRMCGRLLPALDALGKSYEIIFVNDGSADGSQAVLDALHAEHPKAIRVVELIRNTGQHRAVIAGFSQVRGAQVVTLDCDLQNPPEEIGKVVARLDAGHDTVSGVRAVRHDSAWRRVISCGSNWLRERMTKMRMRDHGCMLRAYDRRVVDRIVAHPTATPFVPELAWHFSTNPGEVEVRHEARGEGASNYNLFRLFRLYADLMAASSIAPLQVFTMISLGLCGLCSLWLGYAGIHWLLGGLRTIFMILVLICWLVSLLLVAVGLVGEYVGRIYLEVRARPHFVIKQVQG